MVCRIFECALCIQRSGGHIEKQQVKAGWLGFSASIATGIGGCLIGRYAKTISYTNATVAKILTILYNIYRLVSNRHIH